MKKNMPNVQTSNLPKISPETALGIGFFGGMILGSLGVYMIATKQGRELRDNLAKEFKKHQQNFIIETIIPQEKTKKIAKPSIKKMIKKLIFKQKMNEL